MTLLNVLRSSPLANIRSGTALPVIAAVLALSGPHAARAQGPTASNTPDQTASDPAGSTQIQSSDQHAVERSATDQAQDTGDIVVTGTILRGAAPVGANLISVGEERIQSQGATTSNELLATIPQVTNLFNTVPSSRLNIAANQIQVVRPNLRNLSGETSSSSSTLVLVDGHRIAGVGVTQQAVDPDVIPPGAIERVEVVTDGGSATYGADAVGGVINFITRKRFDGLKVDARYGFADNYYTLDGNVTAGKDWGSGSLFASYSYQRNDALFGRDRDFIRAVDSNTTPETPLGRTCIPGNVQISAGGVTTLYPLPSLAPAGRFNACDESDDRSFIPTGERHGAIAGLHQEPSDWLTVDVRAFYGERTSRSIAPFRGSATVRPTQFFYRPIAPNVAANQTVFFNLAPVLGLGTVNQGSDFQEWGANAEFRAELDKNWQLRTLFNYSESNSEFFLAGLNTALVTAASSGTTAATTINFYDPASTPNLDLIRTAANNYTQTGQARASLFNLRAILDGSLFALPGGDVRLAVGYEYMHDGFRQRRLQVDSVPGALSNVAFTPYSRRVHSAFGELQVPIVGEGNRMGGIYSFVLNGSVRHDRFSDFGSTTNPKIGVSFKPIEWVALRGNYSTSFNAPAPIDQLGSQTNFAQAFAFAPFIRPADAAAGVTFSNHGTVALQGGIPELKPQTAMTYSVGIDLDPPFLQGLRASVNYYHVKFEDILAQPDNRSIFLNFPNNISTSVAGFSRAEVEAFAARAPGGVAAVEPLLASGLPIYSLVDFRRGNYGNLLVNGIDFAVSYSTPTSFGGIDASVSGNYQLDREAQFAAGAPVVDQLDFGFYAARLQLQALLGANIGNFRAQATLNHTSGYDTDPSDPNILQSRVGDFNTVNMFFKYDVPGEGLILRDLSLTLNINNVFDQDPPVYRTRNGADNGFQNGFTTGRLIQIGISKKL